MDDLERLKEASLTSEQLAVLAIRFPSASEIAKADVAQRLLHTARYLQARAEAAEVRVRELEEEVSLCKRDLDIWETKDIRTPGTVEVCVERGLRGCAYSTDGRRREHACERDESQCPIKRSVSLSP